MKTAMKEIKTSKILSTVYGSIMKDPLHTKNSFLAGPFQRVAMSFHSKEDCAYTYVESKTGKKNYRIVLGGRLVAKLAKLPETFNDKEKFRPYFDAIVASFYGLDYHEMGHIKYTDMASRLIVDYPKPEYRNFIHNVFNILEDIVIEMNIALFMEREHPREISPREYFEFMKEELFEPRCTEYKDNGDIASFLNYLLLVLRCGKSNIPNTNAVYEKYTSDIVSHAKGILLEEDPTERIRKCIEFCEWMIENITEFDWTTTEEPVEEHTGKDPTGDLPSKSEKGFDKKVGKVLKDMDKDTSEEIDDTDDTSSEDKSEDEESDDEASVGKEDDEEEDPEDEGEEEKDEKSKAPEAEESMDDCDDLEDDFNEIFYDGDNHEWVIAKEEYDSNEYVKEQIEQQIERFESSIDDITKFLKLFKARIAPRRTPGFTSGKLNLQRAIQNKMRGGCDLKIFDRKIKRGEAPDLCISLVTDNSGSMRGSKSYICSRACIALAQACDWADVPFEVLSFTKTEDTMRGTCITIVEKSLEDSFESSKAYFGINDSSLVHHLHSDIYIPVFGGNSEEINLYYIGQKFARVEHTSKLMIVLCDGATTGSREDLKNVIQGLEDQGITVIGVGICCNEVASIYPRHKIFNSTEELETGLAQYLIDTLSEYAI